MEKSIVAYIRRSKEIIHEDGITTFIKKVYPELRLALDVYTNRSLCHFYIKGFHKLSYYSSSSTWKNTYWLGIPALKCPLDLGIY